MCEALLNILFNYSPRRSASGGEGCGIDLFNLCRATLGDNHFPDIMDTQTVYSDCRLESPYVIRMSGEEIYPLDRQIIKTMNLGMENFRG